MTNPKPKKEKKHPRNFCPDTQREGTLLLFQPELATTKVSMLGPNLWATPQWCWLFWCSLYVSEYTEVREVALGKPLELSANVYPVTIRTSLSKMVFQWVSWFTTNRLEEWVHGDISIVRLVNREEQTSLAGHLLAGVNGEWSWAFAWSLIEHPHSPTIGVSQPTKQFGL